MKLIYNNMIFGKWFGALHLEMVRCSAPGNGSVRCTWQWFGALHLEMVRCSAPNDGAM
jgi:hypothetical protein